MLSKLFALGALALPAILAAPAALGPDSNGFYWIEAEGIKAAFIPYGASITALLLKDRWGIERDVIAGYDNATHYSIDKSHPHFGGVPGRYANRIKNSTFEIDGQKYKVKANDNPTAAYPDGLDTLHGGPNGWDWRNFTVESYSKDAITFSIVDPDGAEGFPGEVISYVTYSVSPYQWDMKIVAISTTKKTPIMLTIHPYWNLDGFSNNETALVLNHTFNLPYGGLRTGVDGILIPTGDLLANTKGGPNDFWSKPKVIGSSFNDPALNGNCGTGCIGYDNCYLTNRDELQPYDWRVTGPVASLYSPWSGIKVDFYTDADAFQFYSCNFQDGKTPLKRSQGLKDNPKFPRTIPKYGCVVMEVQDWIDSINHPEWGRMDKHIYGPGDDAYVIQAIHKFSVV